jgi:hypothetical protein
VDCQAEKSLQKLGYAHSAQSLSAKPDVFCSMEDLPSLEVHRPIAFQGRVLQEPLVVAARKVIAEMRAAALGAGQG